MIELITRGLELLARLVTAYEAQVDLNIRYAEHEMRPRPSKRGHDFNKQEITPLSLTKGAEVKVTDPANPYITRGQVFDVHEETVSVIGYLNDEDVVAGTQFLVLELGQVEVLPPSDLTK